MRDKHQIAEEPCDGKSSSTVLESSGSRARESLTLIISEWLKGMGLELKPSKTRLAHTLYEYDGQNAGFNFLGFNVRQYPAGKHNTGRDPGRKPLGFKTLIKPSKEKIKVHYDRIAEVIDQHKAAPQVALIARLNPIIRGWANYYRTVVSNDIYSELDKRVYKKLQSWAKHRHPKKSGKWISNKYWQTIDGDNWVFATRQGNNPLWLIKHSGTEIERHVKVKGEVNPYDGNLVVRIESRTREWEAQRLPWQALNCQCPFPWGIRSNLDVS